jgi:hypothetical protein
VLVLKKLAKKFLVISKVFAGLPEEAQPMAKGLVSKLLLPAFVVFANACGGTLNVRTNPSEAEIVLVQPGKVDSKPLGKTPYTAKIGDLGSAANGGPIVLQVSKKGFMPQSLYIPNASGSKLDFDVNLKPVSPGSFDEMNRIIKLVLTAERQIMLKQVDEAIKTADAIKAINDNIAMAYEIEAAAQFVKGDLQKARVAWNRSLAIDPENPDAARMIKTIDEKLGTK